LAGYNLASPSGCRLKPFSCLYYFVTLVWRVQSTPRSLACGSLFLGGLDCVGSVNVHTRVWQCMRMRNQDNQTTALCILTLQIKIMKHNNGLHGHGLARGGMSRCDAGYLRRKPNSLIANEIYVFYPST
jgi:hypothetical protein